MTGSPGDEPSDAQIQGDVMLFLFHHHPAHVAINELLRDLTAEPYGPYEHGAVEEAVRDLFRAGLVHRQGEFLFPTLAARHLRSLAT